MKDAAIVLITSQTVDADEAIALNSVISTSKSVRGRVEGQGSRSESAHREIRMGRGRGVFREWFFSCGNRPCLSGEQWTVS